MGRRPTHPDAIPRLRLHRHGAKTYYFYDHGIGPDGKRHSESLGSDYGLAIKRWAELEGLQSKTPKRITFRWVGMEYLAQVSVHKANRTASDNRKELAHLCEFFDDPPAPLDAIKPIHVRQYLDWRAKCAPVRANREKALLSAIWNFARNKGYTELPNPCAGIKGFVERGRDVYVREADYRKIWQYADAVTRDAMDLAYLSGQRPGDVLRLSLTDIHEGAIHVRQSKTHAKLRIEVVGELASVVTRIVARKARHRVYSTRLIVNEYGNPIGVHALSERFRKAQAKAGLSGYQFRDLRAMAATDKEESTGDIRDAQRLLGHTTERMTRHYVRNRLGPKVAPTK